MEEEITSAQDITNKQSAEKLGETAEATDVRKPKRVEFAADISQVIEIRPRGQWRPMRRT